MFKKLCLMAGILIFAGCSAAPVDQKDLDLVEEQTYADSSRFSHDENGFGSRAYIQSQYMRSFFVPSNPNLWFEAQFASHGDWYRQTGYGKYYLQIRGTTVNGQPAAEYIVSHQHWYENERRDISAVRARDAVSFTNASYNGKKYEAIEFRGYNASNKVPTLMKRYLIVSQAANQHYRGVFSDTLDLKEEPKFAFNIVYQLGKRFPSVDYRYQAWALDKKNPAIYWAFMKRGWKQFNYKSAGGNRFWFVWFAGDGRYLEVWMYRNNTVIQKLKLHLDMANSVSGNKVIATSVRFSNPDGSRASFQPWLGMPEYLIFNQVRVRSGWWGVWKTSHRGIVRDNGRIYPGIEKEFNFEMQNYY